MSQTLSGRFGGTIIIIIIIIRRKTIRPFLGEERP